MAGFGAVISEVGAAMLRGPHQARDRVVGALVMHRLTGPERLDDLERLLHYSFFSEHGLTIHDKGIETLIRFMSVKAELFRTIYFHRTVRAIDLALQDLFLDSKPFLFPGSPLEHLGKYLHFTEFSLLVDVQRCVRTTDVDEAHDLLSTSTHWSPGIVSTMAHANAPKTSRRWVSRRRPQCPVARQARARMPDRPPPKTTHRAPLRPTC
jgi:hypothetical protein